MTLSQQVSVYTPSHQYQTNEHGANAYFIQPSTSLHHDHHHSRESEYLGQCQHPKAPYRPYPYTPAPTNITISTESSVEPPPPYPLSSPLGAKSSSTKLVRAPPSPAPSHDSASSTSSKVQFSATNDEITIGQDPPRYSPHASGSSPKSALKNCSVNPTIAALSEAIDNLIRSLVACTKKFKQPSQLDFCLDMGSIRILANVKMNKEWINQLRRLDGLQRGLAAIPTLGNPELETKHKAAGVAIERVLQRMKERQLELYTEFRAIESSLDDLAIEVHLWVESFEYPSKLDFTPDSEDTLILRNTERNKPFINQLRKLEEFQQKLNQIPIHGGQRLQHKRKAISEGIRRHTEAMKQHQLELYHRRRESSRLYRH